jgi:hypothetical protein
MSLGIDSYKSIQPARLQTKFAPLLDGTAITQTDPKCTLDFCNNRGTCTLLDVFINCHCNSGFMGRNCHLNSGGYQTLERYYKQLFNKLMEDLQNTINYYEFKVFHNLFFGASQFFRDTSFFSVDLDTFLSFAMGLFPESIYNNTAEYVDLLDFYFSYEVMRLEQERLRIKNETGLPFRNITVDDVEIFYSYSPTRNSNDVNLSDFRRIDSTLLSQANISNNTNNNHNLDNFLREWDISNMYINKDILECKDKDFIHNNNNMEWEWECNHNMEEDLEDISKDIIIKLIKII